MTTPEDPSLAPVEQPVGSPSPAVGTDPIRALYRKVAFVVFLVFAVGIGSGFIFKTDYVALVPGTARDTEPLVLIEGTTAYPSEGELLLTTVRLRQSPSFWEYLWIRLDDDSRLLPKSAVLGDRTPDENREVNLQMMADSKDVATAVALEELGFETIESNGVLIVQIVEGASADGVIDPGDVLRAIDGETLLTANDLVEHLADVAPGTEIVLLIDPIAGGEQVERVVTLGAKEDDPTAAFLGVGPTDNVTFLDLDTGFDVEIDTGSVGGPSAGLAFTLAILDELTPGELTGGADVAVTGTINVDGSVGSVGGVPQKAAAVRELGVDYFIVPEALGEDTLAEVRERAGDSVEIHAVRNLDEALDVLAELGGDVGAIEEFAVGG